MISLFQSGAEQTNFNLHIQFFDHSVLYSLGLVSHLHVCVSFSIINVVNG